MNKQETIVAVLDVVDDYVYDLPHKFNSIVARKTKRTAKYGYFDGREVICDSNRFMIRLNRIKGRRYNGHYVLKVRPDGDTKDIYPLVFESEQEASDVAEEIASVQNIAVEHMNL